ncbi:MAG: PhnD/SsuA/transferrin family substrate-binding protein [Deltaproteobacteria bacterium]|nr:PhnD/SsuA/transferrin family substrate-binding protein [Deltaproteobacteria bacterium]
MLQAMGLGAITASLSTGCGAAKALPFRFSGIPDADKDQLARRYEVVAQHLSTALGRPAQYVHVPDYTAAVTALAAHKIDAAWLGGVTAVQAEQRSPAGVRYVAARAADLQFRSYFVANRSWVDRGTLRERDDRSPQPLADLAALAPVFARGRLSFGARSSTSGHIMPRWFLQSEAVGIDPRTGFAGPPMYQLQGGHSATLAAVASGAADFGVVNFNAWESADADVRAAAPVVFVTPTYVDYCFVAHGSLAETTVQALRTALVDLDPQDPRDREVLAAFSAESFVAAQPEGWDQIRSVLQTLEQDGSLG